MIFRFVEVMVGFWWAVIKACSLVSLAALPFTSRSDAGILRTNDLHNVNVAL